jgi:hypothetical protein
VKRLVKLVLALGVVGAVAVALKRRPAPPSASPTAPPFPVEPASPVEAPVVAEPDAVPAPEPTGTWVEPSADGGCPDGYPVKAKLSSKIFHVPGGTMYDRTVPDRCYVDVAAAEADGLRQSKR